VQPLWRSDGRELFFVDLSGNLMAVDVSTNPVFQSVIPHTLFRLPQVSIGTWDVAANGERFLMVTPANQKGDTVQAPSQSPITVILNWQAGLKR
jgi:hypothetical protein